jgi:hypothetical protein
MGNSHDKLSKALGIQDDGGLDELDELQQQLEGSLSPEEVEAREMEVMRQKTKDEINQMNQEIADIADCGDEDFIKKALKLVTTKGFNILNTTQKEIENDPRERTIEVASQIMGSITKAVETLDRYNKGETQLKHSEEKIQIRRDELNKNLGPGMGGGDGSSNTVIFATTNDVIQQMLRQEMDNKAEAETEVEARVEDVNDSDTPKQIEEIDTNEPI